MSDGFNELAGIHLAVADKISRTPPGQRLELEVLMILLSRVGTMQAEIDGLTFYLDPLRNQNATDTPEPESTGDAANYAPIEFSHTSLREWDKANPPRPHHIEDSGDEMPQEDEITGLRECVVCGCVHLSDELNQKDKEIERLLANEEKLMLQIERAFEIERERCDGMLAESADEIERLKRENASLADMVALLGDAATISKAAF